MKKKVAVFDIDGTVSRTSLLFELTEELIKEGIFPQKARLKYIYSMEKWRAREGEAKTGFSYNEFIDDLVLTYLKYIRGIKMSVIQKYAKKIADRERVKLYRYTRELINKLQKNYYMLAISHSPYEVVSPFAKSIGFDKVYAMVYEVDADDKYTGDVLYSDIIYKKDKVLKRFIKNQGMSLIGSVGCGDTENDIPFLKLVDTAIAYNPSMKLFNTAKKNKWKVVVERKDVIYEIKKLN